MLLNKFWNWINNKIDDPILIFIGWAIISGFSMMLLYNVQPVWIVLSVIAWIVLSEWMYFDYVKTYNKAEDLGLVKLGCLFWAMPFVVLPMAILAHLDNILGAVWKFGTSPAMAVVFFALGVIVLVWTYFWFNISIAKKVIEKNKRRGKKK